MKKEDIIREKNFILLIMVLMVFISFLAYFLTPLFLLENILLSYLITSTIGLSLGWFIALFIRELDVMTKHHHSSVVIVVLIGSILNFLAVHSSIITFSEKSLGGGLGLAFVFSACFFIPYLLLLNEEK